MIVRRDRSCRLVCVVTSIVRQMLLGRLWTRSAGTERILYEKRTYGCHRNGEEHISGVSCCG